MKYLLSVISVLLFTGAYSQNNNKIVIGTTDTIRSAILNEQREILIYMPASAGKEGKTRYPVIYLLDGYSFFQSFSGVVQYLGAIGKMPEMIVVAICSTDRTKDLTPTHNIYWSDGEKDERSLKTSGGGEKFTAFIQKELIPRIDSLYPTAPYRLFVGHSLGGLLVINTLVNHPALFNGYIAIDPSLWWDNRSLLTKAGITLAQTNYKGKRLYFASANTLNKGMDTIRVAKDTANGNVHVRDNLRFRSILQRSKASQLVWNWKYYADDNHPSVPLIAGYDALRAIFKNYELSMDVNDPAITAGFIKKHFQNVSDLLGYKVQPSQGTVNILGYTNLSGKRYDKAYSFFKMNVDNYPESFNVYDSMGDYYVAVGDKPQAAAAFIKALTIKEHPDTRKKLEELK
ncbi:alpha/beta hydrolase-fold protein [soil metagenome]|jgi:predicted alpha/beta superfamily hydrolase